MFRNLNSSGRIKYLSLNVSEYKHNTNSSAGRQFLSVCNLCNQLENAIAIHGFSYSFMTHVCLEQMSSQVSENACLLTAFIAESLFVTAAVLLVKYKVR